MALYRGKFVCPYSLTQIVWDSQRHPWKLPRAAAPPRVTDELPPLVAPADMSAFPGDDKVQLETFAKHVSTFIKAYTARAVAFDEMKLKRLLTLIADDVLPAWSEKTLADSWSSCSAATRRLDFPVSGVPMTFEVKLCAEYTRTGRCSNFQKQGCCWYGHIANVDAVRSAGNLWSCRSRDAAYLWRIHNDF